jgi:hypothetical protein
MRLRWVAAAAALGALLTAARAEADMGPSCRCRVTPGLHSDRGALAAAIGVAGLTFLLVDRRRSRANAAKRR